MNSFGKNFDQNTINAVWNKGQIIPGYDPSQRRKDAGGAIIFRAEYGNTNSDCGWEIDHIFPVSKGGTDNFSNLQPLNWQNNRHKAENWPNWSWAVTAK